LGRPRYDVGVNKVRVKAWAAWLALLMAVLLPLRGWAMASMLGMPGLPAQQAMVGAAAPLGAGGLRVVTALPCHGGMGSDHAASSVAAAAGHDTVAADGEDGSAAAHTCASCALCHSAIAANALQAPLGPPALAEARCTPSARDTGRPLVDTLERPPRA
jgi:hypothetical protein